MIMNYNDLFKFSTVIILFTLSIYHIMIYGGRKKDDEELYNLYFALFSITLMIFIFINSELINILTKSKLNHGIIMFSFAFLGNMMMVSAILMFGNLFKIPRSANKLYIFTAIIIIIITFISSFVFFDFNLYQNKLRKYVLFLTVINIIYNASIGWFYMFKNKLYLLKNFKIVIIGATVVVSGILISII